VCRAQAYILFYSQRGPPDNRSPIAVSDATAVVAGNIPLVLADRPNPADTVICDGSESATDFDNSKCQNRAPLLPQPPPPSLQLPHTVVVAHEDGDEVSATPVSGKGSAPTVVPQVSGAEAGGRADIIVASPMPGEELSEINGDETAASPAVMGINFEPSPCHSPTCPVACDPGIPLTSSITPQTESQIPESNSQNQEQTPLSLLFECHPSEPSSQSLQEEDTPSSQATVCTTCSNGPITSAATSTSDVPAGTGPCLISECSNSTPSLPLGLVEPSKPDTAF